MKNLDDITIKEGIIGIFKNWKLIIIITIIPILLAGGYVFLIADSQYQSRQQGIITIPISTETLFGFYEFPTTIKWDYLDDIKSDEVILKTIEDYDLDISLENFKDMISVSSQSDRSAFTVSVIAKNPELAQKLLDALTKTYHESVVDEYKERARQYFIRDGRVKISRINEGIANERGKLKILEKQISMIDSKIQVQKLILSDPVIAAQIANSRGVSVEDLTGEFMLEEVINVNYYELEKLFLGQQQIVSGLETNLEILNEQYRILMENDLDEGELDVLRLKIVFKGSPSLPLSPIAPRKMLIMAIALLAGIIAGVSVSFGKFYLTV